MNLNILNSIDFTVVDISWERIFMTIKVSSNYIGDVQFGLVKYSRETVNKEDVEVNGAEPKLKISIRDQVTLSNICYENGNYIIAINIAAVNDGKFLENGNWRLCAFVEGGVVLTGVSNELAYRLDDLSRIFKYGNNRYAYNVSFTVKNYKYQRLDLYINSYFMQINREWKKRDFSFEAVKTINKLKKKKRAFKLWIIRKIYEFESSVHKGTGKNILIMSENKDYLTGNLKAIDERIRVRGLDKVFNIQYSFRRSVGENTSMNSWIKTIRLISKQDFIFIDDYAPIFGYFELRDSTKLIQVWHAGEGFKSVGYSRFGKAGSPFPSQNSHKAYDYALTASENLIPVYEEVFGLDKSAFLATGMARLDNFLDEEHICSVRDKLYQKYPVIENKTVIMFAPTFRGGGQKDAYYRYDKVDWERIFDFCGDDYIFLIKMHPFIKEQPEDDEGWNKSWESRIINVSEYHNINDLFYIADILITDYSSNFYEYAILRKPILFFTYDREFYELTRGVHRDVKGHAPGRVCDTFDELMNALENEEYEFDKTIKFADENFDNLDGHAADRVIDLILLPSDIKQD